MPMIWDGKGFREVPQNEAERLQASNRAQILKPGMTAYDLKRSEEFGHLNGFYLTRELRANNQAPFKRKRGRPRKEAT